MKIFFVLRHGLYLRNYENTIRVLADQGHEIELGFAMTVEHLDLDDRALARRLVAEHPNVRHDDVPYRRDIWWVLASQLRALSDLARYHDARFRDASSLRARAERRVAAPLRWLLRAPGFRSTRGRERLEGVLRRLERAIPSDPRLEAELRRRDADVVVVTPLVDLGSRTLDYVKSARRLGYPTVLLVASWDNLTNKGRIQIEPDLMVVWNEQQAHEATELHRVSPRKIVVSGAQLFDHWFEREPSSTRSEFCRRVGLDPDRPYLLHLCSSAFIAPDEVASVTRWIGQLRQLEDPTLRDIGVLVRPHPAHGAPWRDVDFSSLDNVAIWPRAGAHPVDEESKRDYFDSLHHCAAAVGINTSGLIEAGIVGRRCFTVLRPEYEGSQRGTLHFHMLTEGGLLVTARSEAEQFEQLARAVEGRGYPASEVREFIRSFVRPLGIGRPCSPVVATAITDFARRFEWRPEAKMKGMGPLRFALWPVAVLGHGMLGVWRLRRRFRFRRGAPPRGRPAGARAPG